MQLPHSLLLVLLTLTPIPRPLTLALALPDPLPHPHHQQQLLDPRPLPYQQHQQPQPNQKPLLDPLARQRRLQAWSAQKPLHTTALLAGAAATAVPEAQISEEEEGRDGRGENVGDGTGEKKGWIPGLNWNGNRKGWDEGDVRGGGKVGDVRGERVLEADFEGDVMEEEEEEDGDEGEDGEGEGKDVEMDARWSGSNVRDMFLRVWKEVERIGMVVRRRRRVETAEELDDGHDGDL